MRIIAITLLVIMTTNATADEPADPYLWLEDVTGEKPLDWVRGRNAETIEALAESEQFSRIDSRLLSILDSKDRIPMISKIGSRYVNFWRDTNHPKGVWRRTTLEEYRQASTVWETVLDLDALAAEEHENWVWHGATVLEPADRLCLVSLSRGGADAEVVREFDLERREFVADGFTLPEAKSRVAWRDEDSLFVATDFGPGSMTSSGYPRTVRLWRRGRPLEEATPVFEGEPGDMSVSAYRDHTPGFERDFLVRQKTFYTSDMFLVRGLDRGEGDVPDLVRIEKPDDANAAVHREWLLLELRSDWHVGGRRFKAGSLLATDLDRFMAGGREIEILFEPTERTSLVGFATTRNHVIVTTLDNVRNRLFAVSFQDGRWQRRSLPGLPEHGTATAVPVDDLESDDFFLVTATALEPSTLSLGKVGGETAERLRQGAVVLRGRRAGGEPARDRFEGRNAGALFPDRPKKAAGGRKHAHAALWLRWVRDPAYAGLRSAGGIGMAGDGTGLRHRQHPWRRRIRSGLASGGPQGGTSAGLRGFHRRGRGSGRPPGDIPRASWHQGGSNGGLLMGNMLTMRPDLFGAASSVRCRCSTCADTTGCWRARAGWANMATRTIRRSGPSSASFPPITRSTPTKPTRRS